MIRLKAALLTFLAIVAVISLALLFRSWTDAPSKRSATFALEQYTTHVQHPRTGLCFIVANVQTLSFTCVPCTPEVLREIARAR